MCQSDTGARLERTGGNKADQMTCETTEASQQNVRCRRTNQRRRRYEITVAGGTLNFSFPKSKGEDDFLVHMKDRRWDAATSKLQKSPHEKARGWVRVNVNCADTSECHETSILPLHLACSFDAPSSLVAKLLSAYPEAVFKRDTYFRRTPLHFACLSGASMDTVRTLLRSERCRRTVSSKDIYGRVALSYAVIISRPSALDVVKSLLRADRSCALVQDNHGWLPLHVAYRFIVVRIGPKEAIEHGHYSQILLAVRQAYPGGERVKNASGHTPLDIALKFGSRVCVASGDRKTSSAFEAREKKASDRNKAAVGLLVEKVSLLNASEISGEGGMSPILENGPALKDEKPGSSLTEGTKTEVIDDKECRFYIARGKSDIGATLQKGVPSHFEGSRIPLSDKSSSVASDRDTSILENGSSLGTEMGIDSSSNVTESLGDSSDTASSNAAANRSDTADRHGTKDHNAAAVRCGNADDIGNSPRGKTGKGSVRKLFIDDDLTFSSTIVSDIDPSSQGGDRGALTCEKRSGRERGLVRLDKVDVLSYTKRSLKTSFHSLSKVKEERWVKTVPNPFWRKSRTVECRT